MEEERQPVVGNNRRPYAALDFLLASTSVQTNPYIAAFAKTPFVRALQEDSRYDNLRKFTNIKKEVTEASAAIAQIRRCIARLRLEEEEDVVYGEDDSDNDNYNDNDNDNDSAAADDSSARRVKRFHDGEGLSLVDLCSGKGFLSTMLAWEFPKASIHMCDFDDSLELSHLSSLPNVQYHHQDLFSKDAEDTVAAAVSGGGGGGDNNACIIIGVHLCGELSKRAIQLWRTTGAAAIVLSPCCLPRRRRHDAFGFHIKDQAKRLKVPSYQVWCTLLYGLLPLGEPEARGQGRPDPTRRL